MNTAVALGRLGVSVGFLTQVSRDFFGDLLIEHMRESKVEVGLISRTDLPTTLAFVSAPQGEDVRYAFYNQTTADFSFAPESLPDSLPESVTALQFGSISLTGEPCATAWETLIFRESSRRCLSLDPNIRPSLIPDRSRYLERLERWITQCHLIKASSEDLEWLYPGHSLEQVARHWRSLGAHLVLITDGGKASHAFGDCGAVEVAVQPTQVVDAVGAGDTFHAAVLAWLEERGQLSSQGLKRLTVEELRSCLGFANRVARVVCQREGANPPWRHELEEPA
jgi:fructokinase